MRTKAIFPILLLLAGSSASQAGFSAFAASQTNSNTTTDPLTQLFALIQSLLSKITGIEKEISALQEKTNTLESRISQLANSHQNTTDNGEERQITTLSNSTHNDGHDNENDKENDTHNNGKHLGQDKHGDKQGQNKKESD